jgi:hypothetical protein
LSSIFVTHFSTGKRRAVDGCIQGIGATIPFYLQVWLDHIGSNSETRKNVIERQSELLYPPSANKDHESFER